MYENTIGHGSSIFFSDTASFVLGLNPSYYIDALLYRSKVCSSNIAGSSIFIKTEEL
jgi:hypothetical protein